MKFSLSFLHLSFSFNAKVWFQNRRMKDKRQRIAWPYAAISQVYADPMFAASLLQAAGMPYYAPPQIPHVSIIPSDTPHPYPYGFRYMPYQMIHQNTAGMASLPQSHISPLSTSPNERGDGLGRCIEHDYFESSSSPDSLSSTSDIEKVKHTDLYVCLTFDII